MGKTKTAFVSGAVDQELTSKQKYELKQKKKQSFKSKEDTTHVLYQELHQ